MISSLFKRNLFSSMKGRGVGTLLLLLACPLYAQTELTPFRPGATLEGVNYFLPKTVFEIVLTADKAVTTPGEFAAYSDRYLRQPNVPKEESTLWTLKEVAMYAYGIPDSTKAYTINIRSKSNAPLVSLTDDGLLLGINTQVAPEALPTLPKGTPSPAPVNGRDFMTHEILSAGSTAKMAQLTAEEIYDLRDSRNALIRGEADNTPKDGSQLKLMLDNLSAQTAALEALFKGQTLTSTEVMSFDYEPNSLIDDEGTREMLCRFSRRLGLVDPDDLSGEPVWITIKPLGTLPATTEDEAVAKKKAKIERGVYVNQPLRCRVTITMGAQTLLTTEVPIAQIGTTELLSDLLFDKKKTTRVTIHQHTGSVKDISEE